MSRYGYHREVISMQKVTVIGLGKIGLPLAAQYASKGLTAIGCDISHRVVEAVNAGSVTFLRKAAWRKPWPKM